jgi:hypothetical protein
MIMMLCCTIICIICDFLYAVDNYNEICVIMMYKFSGVMLKISIIFFASNDWFSVKFGRFSANSSRDSVAEF